MIQSFQTSSLSSKQLKLPIIFLGDMAVGKSSIIERYAKNLYNAKQNSTVALDRMERVVTHKTGSYKVIMWDTAGQERFRALIPGYLKMGKFCVIVFDVTNRKSFEGVQAWVEMYLEQKPGTCMIAIMGNKADLQRDVSKDEAKEYSRKLGYPYFEVSALTGENLDSAFSFLIDLWGKEPLSAVSLPSNPSDRHLQPEPSPSSVKFKEWNPERRSCCHI